MPANLAALQCGIWQILSLETLYTRAAAQQSVPMEFSLNTLSIESSPGARWVSDVLIPVMAKTLWDDLVDPPERAATQDEEAIEIPKVVNPEDYARQTKRLNAIERRNAELEARLSAVRPPLDGEQLLTFLPALYAQAFTVLSGADLALLVGRVEPFDIPSPYPEPSPEALHRKQRELIALPLAQQQEILGFAHSVTHRLKLRPEMQPHVLRIQEA